MKNFTYYQPTSVPQALGLLSDKWGATEILAGGTDLLDLTKEYVAQPDRVVSITGIPNLIGIQSEGDAVRIGATTKLAAIADHSELRQLFPALTTAAGMVGGPQIRNMGTIGGNLCQRNRCWYFRDEEVLCLLKGGDKCYALDGENIYHAIFTQGHKCVMVNPSTLAPPLIALGATVELVGPQAQRTVELAKFFVAPASAAEHETVLQPNEILTRVTIPQKGLKSASYEIRQKQSYDWPLVQAAVAFQLNGGKASNVSIVLGHVGPTPVIATAAAQALEGKAINEDTAAAAGEAATQGAKPLSQTGYKVRLAQVAVKRAILTAAGGQKYWEA
ncbi:MAG: FAD binding domain-containing protein [Gemmataceae bacterium]